MITETVKETFLIGSKITNGGAVDVTHTIDLPMVEEFDIISLTVCKAAGQAASAPVIQTLGSHSSADDVDFSADHTVDNRWFYVGHLNNISGEITADARTGTLTANALVEELVFNTDYIRSGAVRVVLEPGHSIDGVYITRSKTKPSF
tara:strand:+ start:710 stop:1153 length:444 start_codon:yes stop_codon:yes gene_type:complete